MTKQQAIDPLEPQLDEDSLKIMEKYDTEMRFRRITVPWLVRVI